jgi:hypothetical protein
MLASGHVIKRCPILVDQRIEETQAGLARRDPLVSDQCHHACENIGGESWDSREIEGAAVDDPYCAAQGGYIRD